MLKVAIVGAGAIGSATAAYLMQKGHFVGVWSQSYSQHEAQQNGAVPLTTTGAVEGNFRLHTISQLADLSGYDVVFIALPATAYADVLPDLARHLPSHIKVIFSGALSLAPLWLREMAQSHGQTPTIIAWGTTLLAAHFQKKGVLHIPFIRKKFDVAAIPSCQTEQAARLCADLFDIEIGCARSVLDACLSNINPIAHAGQIIGNFSRIDRQETWLLFEHFTRSGINIAENLDVERLAIASAFGAAPRSLQQHYALSYNVTDAPLPRMVREIFEGGSRTQGPRALDHRYLFEDMPYGLVFLERLAACAGLNCPVMTSAITLLEVMTQRPIRESNRIIDTIFAGDDSVESIISRCAG
ncbi:hypothetical protein FPY71_04600 [Aureimonas fodinaquatilis]|uniref:2-dehydropantoate 2-reductase n=1 Tax=Aureimonas fodinaquatilis TaxID=2565783 RepID=A0A5B0E4M6_9HYPH|nr:NAD/NADP octopine/nopaline dehydrogenase family protein [Aureimonas fodinaquatilis]KAA0972379.1 hypothetical protein FPY71_04600 [Aureimonas fodinaquatilis]